jgi:serine/threonine protein kinase
MLVDFGFARALEKEEIDAQPKKLRNSIALESSAGSNGIKDEVNRSATYKIRMINETILENGGDDDDEDSIAADMAALESIVANAAEGMRKSVFEPTNAEEAAIMGIPPGVSRTRHSAVSMPLLDEDSVNSNTNRRVSSARRNVRSMSALGTKAYAAPEIRKQLRNKTEADFEKANAAMTECVADYGMIVDAYSVGWTLRVAMTGVPPNFTMSKYMEERDNVVMGDDEDGEIIADQCCCFSPIEIPIIRIRDPSMLPPAATLLITRMTEKNPEDRMTVREAQNDPYILPSDDEKGNVWVMPVGDVPSQHGDPVVPLKCAYDLSQMTVSYHGR